MPDFDPCAEARKRHADSLAELEAAQQALKEFEAASNLMRSEVGGPDPAISGRSPEVLKLEGAVRAAIKRQESALSKLLICEQSVAPPPPPTKAPPPEEQPIPPMLVQPLPYEAPPVKVESVVEDLGDEIGVSIKTRRWNPLLIGAVAAAAVLAAAVTIAVVARPPASRPAPAPAAGAPVAAQSAGQIFACLCGGSFGPPDAAGNNPLLVRVQALPGAQGSQAVVVAFTGAGLPSTAVFTVAPGGAASQTYSVPKCGQWSEVIQSVNGKAVPASDQAAHTQRQSAC